MWFFLDFILIGYPSAGRIFALSHFHFHLGTSPVFLKGGRAKLLLGLWSKDASKVAVGDQDGYLVDDSLFILCELDRGPLSKAIHPWTEAVSAAAARTCARLDAKPLMVGRHTRVTATHTNVTWTTKF